MQRRHGAFLDIASKTGAHDEFETVTKFAHKLSDFPDTFPAAFRKRKLIAVLGPTNSGKTYDAFKRLATARAGAYLGRMAAATGK